MNEREHFFIKIYLSHFIRKGWCFLGVRGELETGTDSYILTQSSYDPSSTSFAFWLGCSTVGHWGPQADCHAGILAPTDSNCNWNWMTASNWLTETICGTWLYFCLTSTCFMWAYASPNSTTTTGQGVIPISSTGCTCFTILPLIYTGASLDWRLGRGSICYISYWRCPWCNAYRPRRCTRRLEFKSWTRLIACHIALILLGKVWIQLFSLQLWVNSRADYALQLWWGN